MSTADTPLCKTNDERNILLRAIVELINESTGYKQADTPLCKTNDERNILLRVFINLINESTGDKQDVLTLLQSHLYPPINDLMNTEDTPIYNGKDELDILHREYIARLTKELIGKAQNRPINIRAHFNPPVLPSPVSYPQSQPAGLIYKRASFNPPVDVIDLTNSEEENNPLENFADVVINTFPTSLIYSKHFLFLISLIFSSNELFSHVSDTSSPSVLFSLPLPVNSTSKLAHLNRIPTPLVSDRHRERD